VVSDDREPPPGLQGVDAGLQAFLQGAQLIVHSDAERLKHQRCRMMSAPSADPRLPHHGYQVAGRAKGGGAARSDQRARQPSRTFELPILPEDALELERRSRAQQIRGGGGLPAVHAHVQRRHLSRVLGEPEAPLRGVELPRRHPEVQEQPIDACDSQVLEHACELAERGPHQRHPGVPRTAEPASGLAQCLVVDVETHQTSGRPDPLQ